VRRRGRFVEAHFYDLPLQLPDNVAGSWRGRLKSGVDHPAQEDSWSVATSSSSDRWYTMRKRCEFRRGRPNRQRSGARRMPIASKKPAIAAADEEGRWTELSANWRGRHVGLKEGETVWLAIAQRATRRRRKRRLSSGAVEVLGRRTKKPPAGMHLGGWSRFVVDPRQLKLRWFRLESCEGLQSGADSRAGNRLFPTARHRRYRLR
jgi:hypothetical protein